MQKTASQLANKIKDSKKVLVAAHIDADGIAAGSIASEALGRKGIEHKIRFFKSLDDEAIKSIRDMNFELTWLVDFGSGELGRLEGINAVITDHHAPAQSDVPKKKRTTLFDFFPHPTTDHVALNPHDFGRDGAIDVSGAGATYLVAKALSPKNNDLSSLAVIGAVGDLQDVKHRKLVGTNETILDEAVKAKVVERLNDLRFFGRESRPLIKFLQYANDPPIPRLYENERACTNFLMDLGINIVDGDKWRSWSDLKTFERRLIISELVNLLLQAGYRSATAERLVGEVYVLSREEGMLRDAKEYSTLLNACGRYEKADVGLRICLGDRDKELRKALNLLQGHREHIVSSLKFIQDVGIKELGHVQYFHGGDKVLDTVIGVMAGIILGSANTNRNLPMIAFANCSEGVKVSARSTKELVARGLDLSTVMRNAAKSVDGVGGGHNIAAGATIPTGKEEEFLKLAEAIIRDQLKS